jgi:isopenicillin-N epimerase
MSDAPDRLTSPPGSTTRRQFLRVAGAAGLASASWPGRLAWGATTAPTDATAVAPATPHDDADWERIAALYDHDAGIANLEGGFFGAMPRPVREAFHAHVDRSNGSYFARREYPAIAATVRARVAAFVGVKPSELVLARNATEALQALIGQYRHVGAGDTVLYADLDYPAMQQAMDALALARGATVARLDFPEPATTQGILDAYDAALRAHPRTRLVLVTHANNKTGLLHPVPEIIALARQRGAECIVDAAHSFGQVPLSVDALGADFVGLNLHKWVGAPVGIAAMVIREARLEAIAPAHGDPTPLARIDGRLHTGTTNFAVTMTVPDALDFQDSIGLPQKAARLRALRDRWVGPAREIPGVEILTPDDPALVGAITGFRLRGHTSREATGALVRRLHDEFGVFTIARNGVARGDCIRVTPTLANLPADCDRLVDALRRIAASS